MKALLKQQAHRIDALSLRERAVMFVTLAVALGAMADRLVLAPLLEQRKQLAAQIRKQSAELTTLRAQFAASSAQPSADTPQGRQLVKIEQLRSERALLDARMRGLLVGPEEIARLNSVLDRVLRRHERLTMTRLSTVVDSTPAAPPAPAAATVPVAPPASASANAKPGAGSAVRWQGVDLSLTGRYLDLMRYLADLERELQGVRWGELKIATKTTPPELTVRLLMAGETP